MEEETMDPEREDGESESSSEAEAKGGISADLIRGHINTIILRTLYERDKYGYEIIEEIEAKSHGQYSLKQPTLYSALKRLESQGYINAYWKTDEVSQGGRRKYYTLTDSGREITERNQAEWEYSRTVIDNLISDRNFDFSQPAPTSIDFKILKNSTTRVPLVKDDDEREVAYDEPTIDQVVEINREDATKVVVTEMAQNTEIETTAKAEESSPVQPEPQNEIIAQPEQPVQPQYVEQSVQQVQYVQQIPVQQIPVQQILVQQIPVQPVYVESAPVQQPAVDDSDALDEEQRKILHENYLKLISEPAAKTDETHETHYAENINTDKLIYNNRPEPERDYKNLINNLFINTVKHDITSVPTPSPQQAPESVPAPVVEQSTVVQQASLIESVRIDDATAKAREDGLSIGTSEGYTIENRRKRYNLGSAMFRCSIIVGVIMLLEFILCLIFRSNLGTTPNEPLSLAYPFVILALAITQVLLFGALYFAGVGKSSKPSALVYISACIIVTVIAVFIIFVVSLLLNVNFAYAGDIMAKIVIPCLVALNITVFGFILYLLSRR